MKVKTRRRKLPVTTPSGGSGSGSGSVNPRASACVIRRFHVLLKRKAQLEKVLKTKARVRTDVHLNVDADGGRVLEEEEEELEEVEREIEELGGLERYQRMSAIGQGKDRGGGSEHVFIGWLRELGVREVVRRRDEGIRGMHGSKSEGEGEEKEEGEGEAKMKLLEVGALKPDNYASCSTWIDVWPIDLRSTHPSIVEQDFLKLDAEGNKEAWDAISLSLVVNFVPEPRDRGRMLCLAHEMLREDGLLFLALPLPCVSNSRYLTFEHLVQIMSYIGFDLVRERWRVGGKMAYWLFRKSKSKSGCERTSREQEDAAARFDKKVVSREGKRNNFCILL